MKEGNLEGIIVPLITPIHDDETPNYSELEVLTDSVINGGVNAILRIVPQENSQDFIVRNKLRF